MEENLNTLEGFNVDVDNKYNCLSKKVLIYTVISIFVLLIILIIIIILITSHNNNEPVKCE